MKAIIDNLDLSAIDNLHQLFCERAARTPDKIAYRFFQADNEAWVSVTWAEVLREIKKWQKALQQENLEAGDSVAIMMRNCVEWVVFDQAALSLGLVVVPLYVDDRPDNVAYILSDCNAQLLFLEGKDQWSNLYDALKNLSGLKRILTCDSLSGAPHDPRLRWINDWLPDSLNSADGSNIDTQAVKHDVLATVVYTSGTTGRPKGVMLSHYNILWNVRACVSAVTLYNTDIFLSFLPLSHTLERTIGYYYAICAGTTVAYARSVQDLGEDMLIIKPTVLISVPRIFERVHNKIYEKLAVKSAIAAHLFHDTVSSGYARFQYRQGRSRWHASFLILPLLRRLVARKIVGKFGGRLRLCITGGAALPVAVARTFIGLGLNILQGYGLTEHSPVISVNTLKNNDPTSVGPPLPGVEIRISEQGELFVRSPSVMLGYLNNRDATDAVIDEDGWLATGDKVEIHDKRIYITGRLKEIIVLSNGEKVPPGDMEMAIAEDPLFAQVMVIGEHRAFLSVLVVLNNDLWKAISDKNTAKGIELTKDGRDKLLLERIGLQLRSFPGYAQIHQITVCDMPWTIENAMLTPTLKLRRKQINAKYARTIDAMYQGH